MRVLGLTGGIACGKSTVAKTLIQHGFTHIDADLAARQVVVPNSPGLRAILRRFGEEFQLPSGELDRKKLGALVFAQPEQLQVLNRLLHPLIEQRLQEDLAHLQTHALLDVALMFEMGLERLCDAVVTVECPVSVQIQRLEQRDGMPRRLAQDRIDAQMTSAERRRRADWTLDNDADLSKLDAEIARLWTWLVERLPELAEQK